MRYITLPFKRFRDAEEGSLTLETVLIVPALFWAFVGCYTFYDAFRQKAEIVRSSYSIADMLSRETNAIDQTYINGLNNAFDVLTNTGSTTHMRVTVVIYDGDDDEFDLGWSNVAGSVDPLTKADLNSGTWTNVIPTMASSDTAVIVETWATFTPIFDSMGLDATTLNEVNIVRPRFAAQLTWDS